VIRNVVMMKLKADSDPSEVESVMAQFEHLDCPGTVSYTLGPDAGLREGNWDWAIVADFADTEAYRGYDSDSEHNRLRGLLAPHMEQVARLQFEVPDAD
jgi:hypothetical protein